jgi:UDP-N-acetylglucosamine 2-epimerase
MLVFGTRPEAIKMAPVVQACVANDQIEPIVCLTGQHREMLDQVTEYFALAANLDLQLMKPDQTLAQLTAACVEGVDRAIV